MKVCFLVPDGTGLRNYLFSKLLSKFDVSDEIVVMTVLPEKIIEEIQELHQRKVVYHPISRYREAFSGRLLKEMITYARLRYNTQKVNNDTIMINWTRKNQGFKAKAFYLLASLLGFFYSFSYSKILKLEKKYQRHLRSTPYFREQKEILKKLAPDVIFCTHQRSIDASVIIEAADAAEIPTIGAVYSWDNLPKARLLVRSRYYVVWSDYMKDEMKTYYPEIEDENIFITGTPQFEFYFDKGLHLPKDEFFKQWGLNPDKKVLCFSGNDLTFPCDDLYLQDLAEELMKMPEQERPQVLLRRCPVDLTGRFDEIVAKYPDLIKVSEPLWRASKDGWDFNLPTCDDVKLLVNVALHSDAVINVGSTMAHDFAVMGKPAIYINYDQPTIQFWSAVVNNKYQHFRSMPSENCVIWLNSCPEIISAVKRAMQGDCPELKDQGEWFKTIALHPVVDASGNIARTISEIGKKH